MVELVLLFLTCVIGGAIALFVAGFIAFWMFLAAGYGWAVANGLYDSF